MPTLAISCPQESASLTQIRAPNPNPATARPVSIPFLSGNHFTPTAMGTQQQTRAAPIILRGVVSGRIALNRRRSAAAGEPPIERVARRMMAGDAARPDVPVYGGYLLVVRAFPLDPRELEVALEVEGMLQVIRGEVLPFPGAEDTVEN